MPIATSFKAIGAGNGFTSCLQSLDVTSFDKWTTLSGVNKDNVSSFFGTQLQTKIQQSLELAMKLYWSGYSIDMEAEQTYNSVSDSINGLDVSNHTRKEPKLRVCGVVTASDSVFTTPVLLELSLKFRRPFKFFYNNNFVGYGLHSINDAFAIVQARGSGSGARVSLYNAVDEESDEVNKLYDYSYVQINNINFVCEAFARRDGLSTTGLTVDASNLTATSNASATRYAEASITPNSLVFYTYA